MNLDMLFDNFEMLADAPNGVPKLREMILQMAVQGKLVRQDPGDEPASVLLEKIKTEKARLIKKGQIRNFKPLPPIEPEEIPYELPAGWEWARVRDITHDLGQEKPKSRFTYIDVSSIDNKNGIISNHLKNIEPEDAPSRARKYVSEGSVIYSTVRPYLLNIAIVDEKYIPRPIVSTAFAVLHPFVGIQNRFLLHYLRSDTFIKFVENEMSGMAYPAISDKKFNRGIIPVPPFDEQNRIVAKIDQLMVLSDKLEARKQKRDKTRIALNDAALDKLLSARKKKVFTKHWNRISNNFDLLYDTPETVNKLRQAILQLAVQGKLVPQDPNDEPASVLLEEIKAEKERLIKKKQIKKTKPLPPITPVEIPYELPERWEWEHLDEICSYIQRGKGPKYVEHSNIPVISQKCIQWDDFYINRARFVDPLSLGKYADERFLQTGDLLWNSTGTGTIGRVNVYLHEDNPYDKVVADSHVTVVRPIRIDSRFIFTFLASPTIQEGFEQRASGTTNQIELNTSSVKSQIVPIPPLTEQTRIVAKVDQLMALCDELESKLSQSQSDCDELLNAILNNIEKTEKYVVTKIN